ncbi:ribonuclease BN [Skermania sp. ID1734]|uniref:YihY/virulence factor BrkB family protein n=1 Tax=Skermania sp. ID1734 TaxID=2597516 RepID=UPI001180EE69|nr:YhjD/YihY/BrkB family envelope integrity protein [Skermania sp. ID1734]TSD97253.1 ribonuclease BN [Skermania sp. ID1734]
MSRFSERLDCLQQRHRWLGFPIAVIYKFVDDQGGYLAALITYYAFVSLFPLLLILTTILSYVLRNYPDLQKRIVDSALSQFPVIGDQLQTPEHLSGGPAGLIVGVAVALYGGLGVAVAFQNAMNVAWSVPRNQRPDPIVARVRGLVLLATVGVAVIGLTVLSRLSAAIDFGGIWSRLSMIGSVALNTAVFVAAFKIGAARTLGIRQVLPGALSAAVLWQLLQTFGSIYVGNVIAHSTATNGVFALVLGLLAFLYLAAAMIVICAEIDVVRVNKLFPRALLTPFTEKVTLTPGDRRTYTGQALAQRNKDFQQIDVSFDQPEQKDSSEVAPTCDPESQADDQR